MPLSGMTAAKVREHIRTHGTFRVEEGPNGMVGDRLFANFKRTDIPMCPLVHRFWHTDRKAAGTTRKITPNWLRRFLAQVGLAKGVHVTDVAAWPGA